MLGWVAFFFTHLEQYSSIYFLSYILLHQREPFSSTIRLALNQIYKLQKLLLFLKAYICNVMLKKWCFDVNAQWKWLARFTIERWLYFTVDDNNSWHFLFCSTFYACKSWRRPMDLYFLLYLKIIIHFWLGFPFCFIT